MKSITRINAEMSFPTRSQAETWCAYKMYRGYFAVIVSPVGAKELWRCYATWRAS